MIMPYRHVTIYEVYVSTGVSTTHLSVSLWYVIQKSGFILVKLLLL